MMHNLKCWPDFYKHTVDGSKKFEIRKDDRGFKPGDLLCLCEYYPEQEIFTGEYITVVVDYVLRLSDIPGHFPAFNNSNLNDYVIMSVHRMGEKEEDFTR